MSRLTNTRFKRLLIYLLPACLFFGLLEGGARCVEGWRPPYQDEVGLGFSEENRIYQAHPDHLDLRITAPEKAGRIFPEMTFKATKPADSYRIFFLGGSSVHFLQEQASYFKSLLEPHLPAGFHTLEVICAGGHAYGSHRLIPAAREIQQYQPDLLLLYCGHNEFEELEQQHYARLETAPLQHLLNTSAGYRCLRDRAADFQMWRLRRRHQKFIEAGKSKPWRLSLTSKEIEARMQQFDNNLRHILKSCQTADIPVFIGIPATNYWRPRLAEKKDATAYAPVFTAFQQGRYQEGLRRARQVLAKANRRQASIREQEILRTLAEAFACPLVDVEAQISAAEPHGVPGETLMRDECHLTEAGNRLLFDAYAEAVRRYWKKIPPPRPDSE